MPSSSPKPNTPLASFRMAIRPTSVVPERSLQPRPHHRAITPLRMARLNPATLRALATAKEPQGVPQWLSISNRPTKDASIEMWANPLISPSPKPISSRAFIQKTLLSDAEQILRVMLVNGITALTVNELNKKSRTGDKTRCQANQLQFMESQRGKIVRLPVSG